MKSDDERAYVRFLQSRGIARKHLFRGQWMTAKEIAAVTGMKERNVHRRIQLGLPLEGSLRSGQKPRRFEFRCEEKTAKEIAAITGLTLTAIYGRISGNRFLERHELADNDLPDKSQVLFLWGIGDTVAGWAKRTGLPCQTIYARLARGWTLKRVLTEPSMRPEQRTVYNRNRRIIRRIAATFRPPLYTGGYEATFPSTKGTGVGRQVADLHGGQP
jgi:hypothetical protein